VTAACWNIHRTWKQAVVLGIVCRLLSEWVQWFSNCTGVSPAGRRTTQYSFFFFYFIYFSLFNVQCFISILWSIYTFIQEQSIQRIYILEP